MKKRKKTNTPYRSIKFSFIRNNLFVLLIALLVVLLGNRRYESQLLQQLSASTESTLSLHLGTIDTTLEHVSTFLTSFLFESENYSALREELTEEEALNQKLAVVNTFKNYLNTYSYADGIFFYLPTSDLFLIAAYGQETIYDRQEIQNYIEETFSDTSDSGQAFPEIQEWFPFSTEKSVFLLQTAYYNGVCVGAYVSSSIISTPLKDFSETLHGTLLLTSSEDDSAIALLTSGSETDPEQASSSGRYLSVTSDSQSGNFSLVLLSPRKILLESGKHLSNILYLVLILTVFSLALSFQLTWRQIIAPLERLTEGMEKLKQGIFNITLPLPHRRNEFSVLTETFNTMSHEIEHLKMQVYENELLKVRTELEYLTLQIKPHFFLNSLNVIYSLAVTKHYELIMELSTCLMRYFRYLFQSSETLVSLEQELAHAKNYLRIQEMRYGTDFSVRIEADETLRSVKIPILSIQTFVENTVKHAYSDKHSASVLIQARAVRQSDGDRLEILIADNGNGFSAEQLEHLNHPAAKQKASQTHIGIANVRQRLQVIYQEQFSLIFRNAASGGAEVVLTVPLRKETIPASDIPPE